MHEEMSVIDPLERTGGDALLATTRSLGCARLTANLRAEQCNLIDDQLLHTLARLLRFETEVELGRAGWLVGGVVPNGEVRVLKRLLAGDALRGVEVEHLGEEVEGERVGLREELLEGDAGFDGKRADVVLGLDGLSDPNEREWNKGLTRGDPTRRRVSSEGVPR